MPMSDEERRAKARAYAKAWYAANPERARENNAAWRAANPEKKRAHDAARRAADPEKHRARVLAWLKEHSEEVIRRSSKAREDLAPHYVAGVLHMSVKELTPELLELKREQLRLKRITRELKKELKNV
jgi:hypothetical protein